jgi:hypothetical protein
MCSPLVCVLATLLYLAFDFGISLCLFGLIFTYYIVVILYFVGICTTMRLHQSNQGHSMACLAFIVCKYQVPYIISGCNLQSMIMYVQYIFLFTDVMWMAIIKRKCKLRWSTVLSISKKRTITPKTPHHISVSAITFTGYT